MNSTDQSKEALNGNESRNHFIVGIGASAGGLEAIQSFFQAMPVNSGLSFVIIQHLSPDYKSLMVELLSRKTDIPVKRAEDNMEVKPNHIYLIQPKQNLTIFHGKLLLKEQKQNEGINLPVDIFLRSLAEDQGEHSIAIILSGSGSDGTRGIRAIKENGGLVIVQNEESSKFDGMPRAAISTGLSDFILSPDEMPGQLISYIQHPYATRQQSHEPVIENEKGITRVFSLLRSRTKVDFTYYKPSTINRRIERRISVTQVENLDAYVNYLETNPVEVTSLYKELLIGVTSFFRDTKVMKQLEEEIMPEIIKKSPNRELRFWIAGCSTGEEAYTLAILAREVMERLKISQDIKIFATDIDRDAIVKAGSGIYAESIAADIDPKILGKYFYKKGENYQIARNIREMVVFAPHNLVKDPPFTRIDFVSCRNLLIYLQTNLQQKALDMFNFSLQPGGVLLLGTSESVGEMESFFEPIDRNLKIYRSKGKAHMGKLVESSITMNTINYRVPTVPQTHRTMTLMGTRSQSYMIDRLLALIGEKYIPLAVVVNDSLEVIHTIGKPDIFFKMPQGRASFDISKMVDKELSIPLTTGIQKVFQKKEEISYTNVMIREEEESKRITLRIIPMPGRKSDDPLVVVFLEQAEDKKAVKESGQNEYDLDLETRQRLVDLEQELQFTRENLQATIEELETSNEELQATNEELLASNEELQSTNEELQSTNEELYTVNAEYQSKIIELTEAQNDVENLMTSSQIGTLILDEDLCIRRFSPEAGILFSIQEGDIGRPIAHLSHNLVDFEPVKTAREVLNSAEPYEIEVQSKAGRFYLIRIIPYHVGPKAFSGIVITMVDITRNRNTRSDLEQTLKFKDDILAHMPSGLIQYRMDQNNVLILDDSNPAASEQTGFDLSDFRGKPFLEIWPGEDGESLYKDILEVLKSGKSRVINNYAYADKKLIGNFNIQVFPISDKAVGVSFDNITSQIKTEDELEKSKSKYHEMLQLLNDAEDSAKLGSWSWDIENDKVTWSRGLFKIFQIDPKKGAPSYEDHPKIYTPETMKRLDTCVGEAVKNGTPYTVELTAIRQSDGKEIECIGRGQADKDENGKIVRLFGSFQVKE